MPDLTQLEVELHRRKDLLRHRRDAAKNGTQRAAIQAQAFMTFDETLALFEQWSHSVPELRELVIRVRNNFGE